MSGLEPILERQMARTQGRWRWLRFWRLFGWLLVGLSGALLAVGVAMHRGWLRNPAVAALAALVLLLAALAGFVTIVAFAAASQQKRTALASALERTWEPLGDRLNTLVFLERRASDPGVASYFRRIARQARLLVPSGDLPSPYSAGRTAWLVVAALAAFAGTMAFYGRYEPWDRLGWDGEESTPGIAAGEGETPPLEPPREGAAEVKAPWGEVRITEPGRDLKVTKVDVVPLQVEAASDRPLRSAAWFTAVGGGDAAEHRLPPPAEPNYAVYKPVLYVDELRLSDWDVLSYYASAATQEGRSYASEVYFLEVRPFREDILKATGGEGQDRKAYRILNELTGLIDRQRQILRETHRHQQQPPPTRQQREQDRRKLEEAEAELAVATRHLYARMAAELEEAPIGDVLTHLSRAEDWMEQARGALAEAAPDAVAKEQGALAELVATRKGFYKALSDNPGAFDEPADAGDLDGTPVAELPDKLKQILELRDEQRAARELVRKTLEEQKKLAQRAQAASADQFEGLAAEQEKVAQPLEDLQQSAPQAFKGAEKEAAEASRAQEAAAEALRRDEGGVPQAQQTAVERLEGLDRVLDRERGARDLADAYRLKEALDRQAQRMERMGKEPETSSGADAARAAGGARSAAQELKDIAERKPVRDAFGSGLRDALADEKQRELERRLEALENARGAQERGRAAGEARQGVERVTRAFEESQPRALKDLQADRLKPGEQEALDRALQQLESLVAQGEAGRSLSPEDEARQRRELLLNLQEGLVGRFGKDPKTTALLLRIEKELAKDLTPVEKVKLKKLLDEIERFRAESSYPEGAPAEAGVTHVDPRDLPAAYRDRIQRYYRKLSEEGR